MSKSLWSAAGRVVLIALLTGAVQGTAHAQSMQDGAKSYKAYVVENADKALAGAKALQAAVKASDVKAAQQAWIESRKGWEAIETVTAEVFPQFDKTVDPWPDAKQGYHAIEAALFSSGKVTEIAAPTDRLVADISRFQKKVSAPKYRFKVQDLFNGTAKLAFEVGESKSKGGESPYAATSHIDMQQNVRGIEVAYKTIFQPTLQKRDAELARMIGERIGNLEKLVGVNDLKSLDQKAVHIAGEELAAFFQQAAPKLRLKTPKVEEEDEGENESK